MELHPLLHAVGEAAFLPAGGLACEVMAVAGIVLLLAATSTSTAPGPASTASTAHSAFTFSSEDGTTSKRTGRSVVSRRPGTRSDIALRAARAPARPEPRALA